MAAEPAVMREVATMPGIGSVISVRSAKAHLSALLELVVSGQGPLLRQNGSKPGRSFRR